MMDKLLHERLRDYASMGEQTFSPEELLALADELERYYIPRPRFEDGEPVQLGDEAQIGDLVFTVKGFRIFDGVNDGLLREWDKSYDACFCKRPAPKVLDADGVEIKVSKPVWFVEDGDKGIVLDIRHDGCVLVEWKGGGKGYVQSELLSLCKLTHEQPVFDADGVRICKGDTVWDLKEASRRKLTVIEVIPIDDVVICDDKLTYTSQYLTHRESDSLEKLRDDIDCYMRDCALDTDTIDEFERRFTALIERGA